MSIPTRVWDWIRRHPYLSAALALVLLVRIALPYVLRPVLEDQISPLLNGRIEIEDVDLSLLRGLAAVDGIRIFEGDEAEASITVERLAANIHWLGIPFQQAVVEEIEVLSPRVRLVRNAEGQLNLARLPVEPEPEPESEDPPAIGEASETDAVDEEDAGWPVGLTRLALADAAIVFRDETLPRPQDINLGIELLEVQRAAYGGRLYEDDGAVTFTAQVAGAPVAIQAAFDSEILQARSNGKLSLEDLNVGLGGSYAEQFLGWTDLRGLLDIEVDFASEGEKARSPRVALELSDFAIVVRGEEQPAVSFDSFAVDIGMIDSAALSVDVDSIRLANFMMRVRPAEEQPLVVLSKIESTDADSDTDDGDSLDDEENASAPGTETAEPGDAPTEVEASATGESKQGTPAGSEAVEDDAPETQPPGDPEVAAAAQPDEPSTGENEQASDVPAAEAADAAPDESGPEIEPTWQVDEAAIAGARIVVEAPENTLEVGVDLTATGLTSEHGTSGNVDLKTAIEQGLIALSGAVSVQPPTFDGTLEINDLSLSSLASVAPVAAAKLLKSGLARSNLKIAVAVDDTGSGEAPPVDATVSGDIGIADLAVAGADADEFGLEWEDLAIGIEAIEVRDGAPAAPGATAPIRIASIELRKPEFRGSRRQDGSIALPPELAGESGEDADTTATPEPTPAEQDEGNDASSDMPKIELGRFRLSDGRVGFSDFAVQPTANPGASKIQLALDGVRMPERRIEKLAFSAKGNRGGQFDAQGRLAGKSTDIKFTVDHYRLRPYDPYALAFVGYKIRSGMLSVDSTISLEDDVYETHSKITVHKLGLKNVSGDETFEEEIGMPVSLALALLKDPQGDIALDVPVSGNRDETNIPIASIALQQLRRVFVNALLSPLKLFGAAGGGDDPIDFGTADIAFEQGSTKVSDEGQENLENLAALLREHPDLAVHLQARNSLKDTRALQEQVLLEELRSRENVRDESAMIRDYLEKRVAGEEAELPVHFEPVLDDLLSHRRPPKEAVKTMSRNRIDSVRRHLVDQLGLRPEQVVIEKPLSGGITDGPPIVQAHLDVVEEEEVAEEDGLPANAEP